MYLSPGQSAELKGRKDGRARVKITATTGDTLGPPWQAPENGYVLQFLGARGKGKPASLYYEPHCRYKVEEFEALGLTADVVVTPVIEQLIMGAYPLVAGQRKAAELARALQAKVVVPMNNGDIDLGGSRLPLDVRACVWTRRSLAPSRSPHSRLPACLPACPCEVGADCPASSTAT